jgi:predicted RNase H-like nuclease (RuvC/YqgF family)
MMTLTIIALAIAILALVGVVAIYVVYIYDDNCCVDISHVRDLKVSNHDLQDENRKLRINNNELEDRLVKLHKAYASKVCSIMEYKIINDKLESENTALKLKLNEMEESRRTTLDHNAYLSKEAIRLNEKNIDLKNRLSFVFDYLKKGLESRMNLFRGSSLLGEQGSYVAYKRVFDEVVFLEQKYESENKECSN